MRARTLAKILAIGGLAFAGGLVVALTLMRRCQGADPLSRVDKLIERCESRIADIEDSLPSARAGAESPA
jgi:hypothetical protein